MQDVRQSLLHASHMMNIKHAGQAWQAKTDLILAAAKARSIQTELSADIVLQCNKLVEECDAWIC